MDFNGKNLRATSNTSSFYFRFDDERMVNMTSTLRDLKPIVIDEVQQEPSVVGKYLDDMKNYVIVEYEGITFYLDNKKVINISFTNLNLSTFTIPFWKSFTNQK